MKKTSENTVQITLEVLNDPVLFKHQNNDMRNLMQRNEDYIDIKYKSRYEVNVSKINFMKNTIENQIIFYDYSNYCMVESQVFLSS
jgi:hypothetical protein